MKDYRYTIQQVETHTDVPAGTLRQWERRYGFPKPQRSDGGFRLFSEHDIELIVTMKTYIEDGVPSSRAAELIKQQMLTEAPDAKPVDALRQALVSAFIALDEAKVNQLLGQAYAMYSMRDVLIDVMQASVVELGQRWHDGTLDIATEHFASNIIQGKLRALLGTVMDHHEGLSVVVACAPLEQHELGALILAIMLRQAGYRVYYLGADTPLKDLRALSQNLKPEVILISATTSGALERLINDKAYLRNISPQLIFGGLAFTLQANTAATLGGHVFSGSAEQIVKQLKRLLRQQKSVP